MNTADNLYLKNTSNRYKPIRINIKLTAANDLTQSLKITSEIVESAWANKGFFLYQLDHKVRRLMRRLEDLHLKIKKKKETICSIQPNLFR